MQRPRQLSASQGPRVAEGRLSAYNIVCPVPDMHTARNVIEELGRRGSIEADNISLTGPAPEVAASQEETALADRELLKYWMGRTIPFAIAGTVVGFVLGLLLILHLPVEPNASNLLTGAFTSAAGFGLGAGLLAGIYFLQPAQPWELTFHQPQSGNAYVAVHSERKEDVDLAERILRELGFTNFRRVDGAAAA